MLWISGEYNHASRSKYGLAAKPYSRLYIAQPNIEKLLKSKAFELDLLTHAFGDFKEDIKYPEALINSSIK